ncbi:DNA-binding Lrp family transcriptional regulator [Paenibacillus rhizosphaerae]|uniref:DNA-binding Lrp family transcriptional regulator n=1 Tax=Paenibacillus rhizosphaerae TaxID=297318 RepID=A0A839TIG1_9BACL|nr:Lrp/AsnC family transcriptional regulator [Paenibacillus rhizosphaerae]MBB3126451.1 DNA-binding Lrp family transcriptional regulator [Paenibacillus rhizosphaerae]
MDHIDLQILDILQRDARISISELGRMINMSGPAVAERIRKLEDKGVIESYRAVLSPEKIGKPITAFILVQANQCNALSEFCAQSPDVLELHQISGQYNFILKVVAASMQSLEDFRMACSKYGFTQTITVLSTTFDSKAFALNN